MFDTPGGAVFTTTGRELSSKRFYFEEEEDPALVIA